MRKVRCFAVVIEVAVDSDANTGQIHDALCNWLHEGDDTLKEQYKIDVVNGPQWPMRVDDVPIVDVV